jgi:hypothetical protein
MSVDLTRTVQKEALRLVLSDNENPRSIALADQNLFKKYHVCLTLRQTFGHQS